MVQEFKFGDRVMLPGGVEAVVLGCDGVTLCAAYADCGMDYFRLADVGDTIVLLHHLDTARLDWLQSNLADVCCYPSQNTGEDWVWACIDSGEYSRAASVREAIDQAMSGEWA